MSAVAQDVQMMNTPVLSGVVAKAKPQIKANQRLISDYYEVGYGNAPFNNGEKMVARLNQLEYFLQMQVVFRMFLLRKEALYTMPQRLKQKEHLAILLATSGTKLS